MANEVRLDLGYLYVPLFGKSGAIPNGKIYIGTVDTDVTIEGNRITVVLQQENGNRVTILPAEQPILTSVGGVPTYNGSPVAVLINNDPLVDYAVAVHNANDVQIYYNPHVINDQNTDYALLGGANFTGEVTVQPPVNDNNPATKLYVDTTTSALDGSRNYTDNVEQEAVAPTLPAHLVRKDYVDGNLLTEADAQNGALGLPSNDCNLVVKSGIYFGDGASLNRPDDVDGNFIVTSYENAGEFIQRLQVTTSSAEYIRSKSGGWSPWAEITTSDSTSVQTYSLTFDSTATVVRASSNASGWTVVRNLVGQYTITHDLGSAEFMAVAGVQSTNQKVVDSVRLGASGSVTLGIFYIDGANGAIDLIAGTDITVVVVA